MVVMCFGAQHACACDKFTWILFLIFFSVRAKQQSFGSLSNLLCFIHTHIYRDGPSSILMRKSMRVEFIAQKRTRFYCFITAFCFRCHFPSHGRIFNVIVHGNNRWKHGHFPSDWLSNATEMRDFLLPESGLWGYFIVQLLVFKHIIISKEEAKKNGPYFKFIWLNIWFKFDFYLQNEKLKANVFVWVLFMAHSSNVSNRSRSRTKSSTRCSDRKEPHKNQCFFCVRVIDQATIMSRRTTNRRTVLCDK